MYTHLYVSPLLRTRPTHRSLEVSPLPGDSIFASQVLVFEEHYTILYRKYTILYYTVLYYTLLYNTRLDYTITFTIIYYTMLCYGML